MQFVRQCVAIQEFFETDRPTDYYECYFDGRLTDYYGWALVKDGIKQIGLAIPADKNAANIFDEFKRRLGLDERRPISRDGALLVRPGADRIFLIGEAGGYISLSSAEGLSYAFKSAKALADSRFDPTRSRFKMRPCRSTSFTKI